MKKRIDHFGMIAIIISVTVLILFTMVMTIRAFQRQSSFVEIHASNSAREIPTEETSEVATLPEKLVTYNGISYSEEELLFLYRVTYAEAGTEGTKAQSAVASVVLNMAAKNNSSIQAELLSFNRYETVDVTNGGLVYVNIHSDNPILVIDTMVPDEVKVAVDNAINGYDPTNGCLYFREPVWVVNNVKDYVIYGDCFQIAFFWEWPKGVA